jgi:hypothetical protein
MTNRKSAQSGRGQASNTQGDVVEQKLVAFAEQLGALVGTVQAKAEGWLDPESVSREVARIRDGAADLLSHVTGQTAPAEKSAPAPKAARSRPATVSGRPSRGPVDAPGKRHRKPVPNQPLKKHTGEPRGKQMGQKSIKNASRSGGRG